MMCDGFGYGACGGVGGLWGLAIGGVMMLLFWGAFIALAIWVVRALVHRSSPPDSALDILRRRLAAGEITPDEYEKTRRILGG